MSSNVYLFDPSTYDAQAVYKPLAQIMREAEYVRSQESGRLIAAAFKRLAGLFRPRGLATPITSAEVRKAA